MMIQNRAYKTATLSLILLMSAQAIKADQEVTANTTSNTETTEVKSADVKPADKVVAPEKAPITNDLTTKEEPKAEAKLMNAQAIKADQEVTANTTSNTKTTEVKSADVKQADKVVTPEKAPIANDLTTKEEPKAEAKKEEKKVVKARETRLRDNEAVSAFISTPWKRFKQWARIESKSNKANAANDAYEAIESRYKPSETDNEIQLIVKEKIYPHIVAVKEAKEQKDFARMEKELAIIEALVRIVPDLQDAVGCLGPITKTEKDLQEALIKAERPIVAPILKFKELWNESGKKIEDILNKHASAEAANFQELTAELAVMQKALTGLYEQDLANPINEKRIAKSKIQTLKDYLGYVAEKIAPENDLAKVGDPESNKNLPATLPADTKASKEAQEVKAEEAKKTEASETK